MSEPAPADRSWVAITGKETTNWLQRYSSSPMCYAINYGIRVSENKPNINFEAGLALEAVSFKLENRPDSLILAADKLAKELNNRFISQFGITPALAADPYLHHFKLATENGYAAAIQNAVAEKYFETHQIPHAEREATMAIIKDKPHPADFQLKIYDDLLAENQQDETRTAHYTKQREAIVSKFAAEPQAVKDIRAQSEECIALMEEHLTKSLELLNQHAQSQQKSTNAKV